MICPNCNARIEEDVVCCPECGSRISKEEAAKEQEQGIPVNIQQAPEDKGHRGKKKAVILVIAVFIVGMVIFFVYRGINSRDKNLEDLKTQIQELTSPREDKGEKWAVYVKRLSDGAAMQTGEDRMQSASLIKLFTAVCVYENFEFVEKQEKRAGETEKLLGEMISASDNEAANTLVLRLGGGNAPAGMKKVNAYCVENGYDGTYMGRLMLDFDASDDNYTTVEDCGKLLEVLYNGQAEGAEEIVEAMKAQKHRRKIPAGIPDDILTANKTGELDTVENDAAIIYDGENVYILCVMSENLNDARSARKNIREVSQTVYTYMNK